jgi:hypothetical protein
MLDSQLKALKIKDISFLKKNCQDRANTTLAQFKNIKEKHLPMPCIFQVTFRFNRALKRKDEKTDYPGPGKYNIS